LRAPSHLIRCLVALFMAFGLATAAWGQTFPGKVGVGLEGLGGRGLEFVDVVKTTRTFEAAAGGAVSMDADGWPNADARTVLFDMRPVAAWAGSIDDPTQYQIDVTGTYKLSLKGQADIGVVDGSFTVTSKLYDSPTNTTTADLNISGPLVFISFTNTRRTAASALNTGFTSLRITRPGYAHSTSQIFHTPFINCFNSAAFSTMRFMDWTQTNNNNPTHPARTEWADRPRLTDASWTDAHRMAGAPWEYCVALGNQLNKDIWINVPVAASDDYVTKLAQLVLYGSDGVNPYTSVQGSPVWAPLNPGLNVYVEYSNEVWNWGFWQATWNNTEAGVNGLTYITQYARRTAQISNLFRNVFGAPAINNRVRVVNCWQIGWNPPGPQYSDQMTYINSNFGAPNTIVYGLGVASYFSEAPAAGESVSAILAEMRTSSDSSVSARQQVKAVADTWGLPGAMLGYEGGPDNGGGDTTNIANRITANRDVGMKDLVIHDLRDNWYPQGGQLFMYFTMSSGYNRYGCWGLTDDVTNPDRNSKFQAIRDLLGTVTQVAAPSFSPPAGTYTSAQSVTITSATSGASIRYTTDGSTPTSTTGTLYSTPVSISVTTTLKAIAYKSGMSDSSVATGVYTINTGGTLPAGWTALDIGGPTPAGSSSESGGVWTVKGGGADITGSSDQFHLVSRDASGNVTIVANCTAVQNTNSLAKAGVMVRDGTAANARYAAVFITPSNTIRFQRRTSVGGTTANTSVSSQAVPKYLRLQRVGNVFSAYYSSNGTTWTQVGINRTVTMAAGVKVGLGVTSHAQGTLNTSTFNNVSVTAAPPPAPTNLAATPGNAQVALTWTASSGATGYKVYYSTGGNYYLAASPTATNYTHTGLTNGTAYQYYVTATNFNGESSPSNTVSATPTGGGSPPSAPTGLAATAGDTQVSLTWNAVSGATSYAVKRSTTSGGPYTTVAPSVATTSHTDTGLSNGTTYYYVVTASNAYGESGNSNQASATPVSPSGVLLASDAFPYATGTLHNMGSAGSGWGAAWQVQNADTSVPGYNVANTSLLSYLTLSRSGNYAIGGDAYQTSGRAMDAAAGGTFGTNGYLTGSTIGASGKTLWMSMMIRKDAANDQECWVMQHADQTVTWPQNAPRVGVGYFGAASNTGGTRYWSVKVGATVVKSNVALTVGQTALLVVKVTYGATTTVDLYVNPASLGGAAPGTANATTSTTSSMAWINLGYYAGDAFSQSSIDEIRFGTSYAVVTP
jgi:hypothetical protein